MNEKSGGVVVPFATPVADMFKSDKWRDHVFDFDDPPPPEPRVTLLPGVRIFFGPPPTAACARA